MLEFPRWKYAVIVLVVLLSTLYALPNIYPQDPSVQITANRGAAIDAALQQKIEATLSKEGIATKSVEIDDGDMLVRLPGLDEQTRAADTLRPALGDNYVVALNLASTVPSWLETLHARPMLLGLDLQGGVHFLLQVDQKAALEKRFEAYAEDVRVALRDARVGYESVERQGSGGVIRATLAEGADSDAAVAAINKAMPTMQLSAERNVLTVTVPEAELSQQIRVETGRHNTFVRQTLGVDIMLQPRWTLQSRLEVNHDSAGDGGRGSTDTHGSLNLHYAF